MIDTIELYKDDILLLDLEPMLKDIHPSIKRSIISTIDQYAKDLIEFAKAI